MSDREAIARRIRERRLQLNLRQEDVAEKIGLARVSVSQIETGRNSVTATQLGEIAKLLRVPIDYFYSESSVDLADEGEVISFYRGMSPATQEKALAILRALFDADDAAEARRRLGGSGG